MGATTTQEGTVRLSKISSRGRTLAPCRLLAWRELRLPFVLPLRQRYAIFSAPKSHARRVLQEPTQRGRCSETGLRENPLTKTIAACLDRQHKHPHRAIQSLTAATPGGRP